MRGRLFEYPPKAAFGRVLPKSKVFAFGKVTRRVRDLFAAEIDKIVWQFKLAPETINLPAGPGVTEIQVLAVDLKTGVKELTEDVLYSIDDAIGFPIIFEIAASGGKGDLVKAVAAYKRPSEADSSKWVVGEYISTEWMRTDIRRAPLPTALNLAILYEQMLRQLTPVASRSGETLQDLVERHRLTAIKQREVVRLEARLKREKQFNRRVELNAQVRAAKAEVEALANGKAV